MTTYRFGGLVEPATVSIAVGTKTARTVYRPLLRFGSAYVTEPEDPAATGNTTTDRPFTVISI